MRPSEQVFKQRLSPHHDGSPQTRNSRRLSRAESASTPNVLDFFGRGRRAAAAAQRWQTRTLAHQPFSTCSVARPRRNSRQPLQRPDVSALLGDGTPPPPPPPVGKKEDAAGNGGLQSLLVKPGAPGKRPPPFLRTLSVSQASGAESWGAAGVRKWQEGAVARGTRLRGTFPVARLLPGSGAGPGGRNRQGFAPC